MKMQLTIAVTVAIPLVLGGQAVAGPLGDLNRDIGAKQERARSQPAAPAPRPPERTRTDDSYELRDDQTYGSTVLVYGEPDPNYAPAPFHLDVLTTYQNIDGSDGALNADLRLGHGPVALAFSSSSFYEGDRADKGGGEEQARLTRWEVALQGRALAIARSTELWIGVGFGQLHGTGFDTVGGLSLGAQLRHRLDTPIVAGLAIEAGARGMMYADDLSATELRAGVTASILHVGYRRLEFNVGPPLAGPEVGVSLHF